MGKLSRKSLPEGNSVSTIFATIRTSGYRLTNPRKLIVNFLAKSHGPFTIEEIHAGIRNKSCNLTTVYRNLRSLEDIRLVRRLDFGDRINRFELVSVLHPHHHLVCRDCHKVEVVDDPLVPELDRIARSKGFTKVNPWLELFGTCASCTH